MNVPELTASDEFLSECYQMKVSFPVLSALMIQQCVLSCCEDENRGPTAKCLHTST